MTDFHRAPPPTPIAWTKKPAGFHICADCMVPTPAEKTARAEQADKKHHPHLRRARRTVWCACECGWTSGYYKTVTGAHLAFGAHLLESK